MPDDQFQFDAKRHAELVALVVGEPGVVLALRFGQPRSAIALGWLRLFRQPGVVVAWWVPVRRIIRGRWLQLRWFRAAPTAAAARLAHASVFRRFAGQRTLIVRITGRRGFRRRRAGHAG